VNCFISNTLSEILNLITFKIPHREKCSSLNINEVLTWASVQKGAYISEKNLVQGVRRNKRVTDWSMVCWRTPRC